MTGKKGRNEEGGRPQGPPLREMVGCGDVECGMVRFLEGLGMTWGRGLWMTGKKGRNEEGGRPQGPPLLGDWGGCSMGLGFQSGEEGGYDAVDVAALGFSAHLGHEAAHDAPLVLGPGRAHLLNDVLGELG